MLSEELDREGDHEFSTPSGAEASCGARLTAVQATESIPQDLDTEGGQDYSTSCDTDAAWGGRCTSKDSTYGVVCETTETEASWGGPRTQSN